MSRFQISGIVACVLVGSALLSGCADSQVLGSALPDESAASSAAKRAEQWPKVTFDPCTGVPQDVLLAAGLDPASGEPDDYIGDFKEFKMCQYRSADAGLAISVSNIPFPESMETAGEYEFFTPTAVNDRQAATYRDSPIEEYSDMILEMENGFVALLLTPNLSLNLTFEQSRTRLIEAAKILEPALPRRNGL